MNLDQFPELEKLRSVSTKMASILIAVGIVGIDSYAYRSASTWVEAHHVRANPKEERMEYTPIEVVRNIDLSWTINETL